MRELPDAFLYGGDYNPDQWLDRPDILEQDIRYMKEARVNCVSVGIFAWAKLEPREGEYDFAWLDAVIDRLWAAGIRTDLATPSGARPAWLAQKYPEVLRADERFRRRHFGERHNHCLTSPVYREKVRAIDSALAARYGRHPGVTMWHLSNEYGGDCFCPLCAEAFRAWLKEKYGTLEELNRRWYTSFWSQTYSDWSQVEPPSPAGETSNPAMQLDWRRFETRQVRTFIETERDAVRSAAPDLPVTINLMCAFRDYDYYELAKAVDLVSWDSYPEWRGGDDTPAASDTALNHDLMRSLKDRSFLLMECTPSQVNWKPVNKLKKPGGHMLSSLQAAAHGSDSVMMFQWRKSRGGAEQFHGAAVSHDCRDDTRVFREVVSVGETLEKLRPVLGERVKAEACVLYDWECRWALDLAQTGLKGSNGYYETVRAFHRALWLAGIPTDLRGETDCDDLAKYKLVIAPMLFLTRGGMEEKLRRYAEGGGTLLVTWMSGVVNGDGEAWQGDAPHGLTDVLGLRAEELDALYPEERNELVLRDGRRFPLSGLCELPEDVTAETVGVYGKDFYAGRACLTRKKYGKGAAWYLAARPGDDGIRAVVDLIAGEARPARSVPDRLPDGVIASRRGRFVFLQNYTGAEQAFTLSGAYRDAVTGERVTGGTRLPERGVRVLEDAEK